MNKSPVLVLVYFPLQGHPLFIFQNKLFFCSPNMELSAFWVQPLTPSPRRDRLVSSWENKAHWNNLIWHSRISLWVYRNSVSTKRTMWEPVMMRIWWRSLPVQLHWVLHHKSNLNSVVVQGKCGDVMLWSFTSPATGDWIPVLWQSNAHIQQFSFKVYSY